MKPFRLVTICLVALLFVTPILAKAEKKPPPKKKPVVGKLCSLVHYPIAVGDINEYRMTSIQLDAEKRILETTSNTYSEEITLVQGDRFRTKSVSEGNTSESEWLCSAEGIKLKIGQYPDTKLTTTGVTIPAKMRIGDVWNQTFALESPGSRQQTSTVNRVTKREEVIVPAGTFDAYRVDYDVETTIAGEAPTYAQGTQWFAPGVGVVKSTSVINMESGEIRSIESTTELIKRTSK